MFIPNTFSCKQILKSKLFARAEILIFGLKKIVIIVLVNMIGDQ